MFNYFIGIILAYFLGAIPVAYIIGKKVKGIDIRKHGSGNVGSTNAFRVLGKGPGTVVLAGDLLKGYLAAYLCFLIGGPNLGLAGAIAVIAGHSWSIFLNFKGGKGVAAGGGAFLALMPVETLIAIIVFVSVIYFSRYVSLGSIVAALVLLVMTFVFKVTYVYKIFACFAVAVVIIRHIPNIKRLLNGNENKVSSKK